MRRQLLTAALATVVLAVITGIFYPDSGSIELEHCGAEGGLSGQEFRSLERCDGQQFGERHLRRLRDRFEAEGAERVSGRRACSSVNTGISPRLTTCFGPRTECARKPRCPFAVNGHILGWPTHKDKSSEFSATYVLTTNQNGR